MELRDGFGIGSNRIEHGIRSITSHSTAFLAVSIGPSCAKTRPGPEFLISLVNAVGRRLLCHEADRPAPSRSPASQVNRADRGSRRWHGTSPIPTTASCVTRHAVILGRDPLYTAAFRNLLRDSGIGRAVAVAESEFAGTTAGMTSLAGQYVGSPGDVTFDSVGL